MAVLCEKTLKAIGCGSAFGIGSRPSRISRACDCSSSIAARPAPLAD